MAENDWETGHAEPEVDYWAECRGPVDDPSRWWGGEATETSELDRLRAENARLRSAIDQALASMRDALR